MELALASTCCGVGRAGARPPPLPGWRRATRARPTTRATGWGQPSPSPRLARESWRGGAAPGAGAPDTHGSQDAGDSGAALLCVACGARITDPSQAIGVEGAHRHVKTNPAGFTFEIGCFRRAPGAASSGRPTAEHCWFAGYRWRFASCGACGVHLGWAFLGGGAGFFGLILDRLVPDAP